MTIILRRLLFLSSIFAVALVLSACNLYKTPTGQNQTGNQTETQEVVEGAASVTFSDTGFSPASLEVQSGQAVTWVNNSSKTLQIASDNHPTHNLNRELTSGQFVLEVAPGKSASVTLTKQGSWGYHNHLNPGQKGTVVVK